MPDVIIKARALHKIQLVADFIESKNVPGSSQKWVNELFEFISSYSKLNIEHPLCHNAELARKKYSCIIFKDKWVIAFRQTKDAFTVYEIIWGPNLK